jgi:hypothetical protein
VGDTCSVVLVVCMAATATGACSQAASVTGPEAAVIGGTTRGGTLVARYPGDAGIEGDPAVVWAEGFEQGSVAAVTARYDNWKNAGGMALVADVPPGSAGLASLRMTAGAAMPATDLYKRLPDRDEIYARWYVKYQAGVQWHHSGVWIGGYAPPSPWPSPHAGTRPNGDDRFSVAVEPVFAVASGAARLDFYNYWMRMHSWMDAPSGGDAYYGNTLVHLSDFTVDAGRWLCLEVHVRLNTSPSSAQGAVLEVWKDDVLVQRFDDNGPRGYWIRDKFCPAGADGAECTNYPAAANTVLDLQFRSTPALRLNAFWPQNYITSGPVGSLQFDNMVLAGERVGCLR